MNQIAYWSVMRMALAQRVVGLSGRTVREVLKDDVSND